MTEKKKSDLGSFNLHIDVKRDLSNTVFYMSFISNKALKYHRNTGN